VVVVRRGDEGGRPARYEPVNSCLVLAAALEGQEVWTAEGLADGERLHPVQTAMVERGGSQCGYCTPGFVVSLFAEYYREGRDGYDPEAISGNLCRCTGYRPIRDAARSLGAPEPGDRFLARLDEPPPDVRGFSAEASASRRFHRPATLDEALALLAAEPAARVVAGGTDVVVGINQSHDRFETIVALDAIEELRFIERRNDVLVLGAGVPLSRLEDELRGELPMLDALFPLFSSRLIRNRATLGGNLVNASPIGDTPPALLALDAEVVVAGPNGERTVPLDGFFTAYRKTALAPGELVTAVRIPRPFPTINRFYKVSKRVLDDISTVAAGFGITLDADGATVTKARLAYGGVAATPARAHDAEDVLVGKPWSPETIGQAQAVLERTFSPITDQRGSERYRSAMVTRLLDKLWADTRPNGGGGAA
jgi:xanthine dehydrogenase small subunit